MQKIDASWMCILVRFFGFWEPTWLQNGVKLGIKSAVVLILIETGEHPKNIYFDPYTLGEGLKSVTFSLVFQHSSKTLEESDVNPINDEIVTFAEKKFYAKLRM